MLVVTVDETNFVSGSVSATDANFVKDVFTLCMVQMVKLQVMR